MPATEAGLRPVPATEGGLRPAHVSRDLLDHRETVGDAHDLEVGVTLDLGIDLSCVERALAEEHPLRSDVLRHVDVPDRIPVVVDRRDPALQPPGDEPQVGAALGERPAPLFALRREATHEAEHMAQVRLGDQPTQVLVPAWALTNGFSSSQ
jgi:hypothetical protein